MDEAFSSFFVSRTIFEQIRWRCTADHKDWRLIIAVGNTRDRTFSNQQIQRPSMQDDGSTGPLARHVADRREPSMIDMCPKTQGQVISLSTVFPMDISPKNGDVSPDQKKYFIAQVTFDTDRTRAASSANHFC